MHCCADSGERAGVFNRLGNNNSFQALADSSTAAPGRIAFGAKANADQRNKGFGQSHQQNADSQQIFPQNRKQQQQGNRSASQSGARHHSSR